MPQSQQVEVVNAVSLYRGVIGNTVDQQIRNPLNTQTTLLVGMLFGMSAEAYRKT